MLTTDFGIQIGGVSYTPSRTGHTRHTHARFLIKKMIGKKTIETRRLTHRIKFSACTAHRDDTVRL